MLGKEAGYLGSSPGTHGYMGLEMGEVVYSSDDVVEVVQVVIGLDQVNG